MNKHQFLKFLKHNNIKFLLLSDDLKNNDKDLDLYIDLNYKKKFEKLIFRRKFFKRKKEVLEYPNRFFYYSELSNEKIILDVSFKIVFFKNNFIYYQLKDSFLSKFNHNSIFIIKIARMLFYKKNNLKLINSFIFNAKNSSLRKKFYINKRFKNISILENYILSYFDKKLKIKFLNKLNFKSNYVLFLGSDGVGKTTLIDKLKIHLNSKIYSISFGISEKYWFSKKLYLLACKFNNNSKMFSLFFLSDLVLRRIKLFLIANHHFIFIDRFPGFIFKKNFKRKIFSLILPSPDLIFLLKTKNDIRKKRKPLEYKDDYSKWIDIINYLKIKPYVINTSFLSISKTINKTKKILFSKKKHFNHILEN